MYSKHILFSVLAFMLLFFLTFGASVSDNRNDNPIPRSFDAKGMLNSLAGSIMSRGFGTTETGSQVVSLNLTNLLVLVLLKALIFAAGSIGAGNWKGGYARSVDGEEKLLTDEEILLFLSYLTGERGCLQNIACQQPDQAKRYAAAGDMLLRTMKALSMEPDDMYQYALQELQQASNVGFAGDDCKKYICDDSSN